MSVQDTHSTQNEVRIGDIRSVTVVSWEMRPNNGALSVVFLQLELIPDPVAQRMLISWQLFAPASTVGPGIGLGKGKIVDNVLDLAIELRVMLPELYAHLEEYLRKQGSDISFSGGLPPNGSVMLPLGAGNAG